MEGERARSPAPGQGNNNKKSRQANREGAAQAAAVAADNNPQQQAPPPQQAAQPAPPAQQQVPAQQQQQPAQQGNQQVQPAANVPNADDPYRTIERLRRWPIIETGWRKGTEFYGMIRDSNRVFRMTLTFAENTYSTVNTNVSQPIVRKLNVPIRFVDNQVDRIVGVIEVAIPQVHEQPMDLFNTIKTAVVEKSQPVIDRAIPLVTFSKTQVNRVLSTTLGHMVIVRVNNVIEGTDQLVDHYIPAKQQENQTNNAVPLNDDPVLHIAQTVSFIMSKVTRRIFVTLAE